MTSVILYRLRLKCREHPYLKPLRFCSLSPGVRFLVGQRSQLGPTGTLYTFDDGKCSRRKPIDIRVRTPILLSGSTRVAEFKPEVGCQPCTLLVVPENGSQGLWAEWVIPYPSTSPGTQSFLLIHLFLRINMLERTCPGSSYLELSFILAPSLLKTHHCNYEPGDVV